MNTYTLHEIEKDDPFDPATLCEKTPFTQASFYGDWQTHLGRKVRRFLILREKKTVAYFQMVSYPLLLKKTYVYIPYGPITKDTSDEFFAFLKKKLKRLAKEENAVFVRLDITPLVPNKTLGTFFTSAPHYTYQSACFQPRTEWFLNIENSEEELLGDMHKKNRYAINAAERKEVVGEIVTENFMEYFDTFYSLLEETASRNHFHLHEKSYYQYIFEHPPKDTYLSIAKFEDTILAIGLTVVFGKTANYIFAGSCDQERDRMPSYAVQWTAIRHAKNIGCSFYNFGGITTEDEHVKDWSGLTRFKKRFGGEEVRHSDFFDVVAQPVWYLLYTLRKLCKKALS